MAEFVSLLLYPSDTIFLLPCSTCFIWVVVKR